METLPLYIAKLFFLLMFVAVFTSCTFIPEKSKNQQYAHECDMFTKKLSLTYVELQGDFCGNSNDAAACLFALGVAIPIGSLLVSGSVILIGNTLHWLEYQGSCDEGVIANYLDKLKSTE